MVELSPFFLASNRFGSVRDVDGVIFGFVVACGGDVDELQYERSTCYDAAATGRKSLPTMFSRTEDLPEDWEPTVTLLEC